MIVKKIKVKTIVSDRFSPNDPYDMYFQKIGKKIAWYVFQKNFLLRNFFSRQNFKNFQWKIGFSIGNFWKFLKFCLEKKFVEENFSKKNIMRMFFRFFESTYHKDHLGRICQILFFSTIIFLTITIFGKGAGIVKSDSQHTLSSRQRPNVHKINKPPEINKPI